VHGLRSILVLLAVVAIGAATVAFAGPDRDDDDGDRDRRGDHRGGWKDRDDRGDRRGRFAFAALTNAAGERVGHVFFRQRRRDGSVWVFGRARGLPAGFHGFHVHTTGVCEPPFTSAGGHYNPAGTTHRGHAGDMPTLLINADGRGFVAFATDRFSVAELRDDDGSAVIVHEFADNYANIPNRYRSPESPPDGGPDAATLATGDAGNRLACGVVR
jgi:superoxide dismutase, Cu-Zn family